MKYTAHGERSRRPRASLQPEAPGPAARVPLEMNPSLSMALEPGFAARLEFQRPTGSAAGWSLVLVVPEQEFPRFGAASVLDLLDFAAELEESVLCGRVA